jgi:predicted transcriptional regulator
MTVRVFSARVKGRKGSRVTVIAEASADSFELSTADEDELLESIAEADRGETISAAELLQRLQP